MSCRTADKILAILPGYYYHGFPFQPQQSGGVMSLEDQIQQDYVAAMKARDSVRSGVASFLRAQLKNVKIDKRVEKLEDPDVIQVIKKQIKQREDSIQQFTAGGRPELAAKETVEMTLLKAYLPQEIPADQLKIMIQETIKELKATSVKEMGAVIKAVGVKTQGRADNRTVSEMVKQALAS